MVSFSFKEERNALVNYTGKYLPMPAAALSADGTRGQLETILLWGSVIRNWENSSIQTCLKCLHFQ